MRRILSILGRMEALGLLAGVLFLMTACSGKKDADTASPEPKITPLPAMERLLGPVLTDVQGAEYPVTSLRGKLIGLYFAAEWDPPSCYFTPKLVSFWQQMKQNGKLFEVVLVSDDRTASDMQIHMKNLQMPWLALPFVDGSHQMRLKQFYGIINLPVLIIVDDSGEVITTDGRADVMRKNEKAYEAWR